MKAPCWLVGHRPEVTELPGMQPATYEETCKNCSKTRRFIVTETGRHDMSGWKVPATA